MPRAEHAADRELLDGSLGRIVRNVYGIAAKCALKR
jgi:hypothetical protein